MSSPSCVLDSQRECLGLQEVKRLEADLNDLRRQNSNTHERMWDELHTLKEISLVRDEQYRHILEKLTDLQSNIETLKENVESIEKKPAKRYEDMFKQVISILIAAIVGAVLAKIGLAG